jgi:hypothetical protein
VDFPKHWGVVEHNQFWIGLFLFVAASKKTLGEHEQALLEKITPEQLADCSLGFEKRFGNKHQGYFAVPLPQPQSSQFTFGSIRLSLAKDSIGLIHTREASALREGLMRAISEQTQVKFTGSALGQQIFQFWCDELQLLNGGSDD